MAQRAGAAIDVHLLARDAHLAHERHRDHGEGLVDLPEVDVLHRPADPVQKLVRSRHRRRGEPARRVRVSGMARNPRPHRQPPPAGRIRPGEDHRRRPVRDRGGVGRRHRAAVSKGGPEMRDLVGAGGAGLFVRIDAPVAAARGHRDRHHLGREVAIRDRGPCSIQRGKRVGVLRLAGELVVGGALLGEGAHQEAAAALGRGIGVFQPVEKHVVDHAAMSDPRAAAHLGQQIRRVGHRFHAAGDDDVGLTGGQPVPRRHRRGHARAAHLVQRRGRHPIVQARGEGGLSRRGLPQTRREHAAHHHRVHALPATALQRPRDRRAAQRGCVDGRQGTLKAAHRRARRTRDHDLVHSPLPRLCPADTEW